jgi:hypothetical protein
MNDGVSFRKKIMQEEKLTENIDIRSNKYSKNGFDYYCRNSYGKFHIPMDHLTPEDLRAIADHLENNPPLNKDSTVARQVSEAG